MPGERSRCGISLRWLETSTVLVVLQLVVRIRFDQVMEWWIPLPLLSEKIGECAMERNLYRAGNEREEPEILLVIAAECKCFHAG